MVNYRRNKLSSGVYFFTVTLQNRKSAGLTTHIDLLSQAFRQTKLKYPFVISAIVVLPDHLHCIMTLPEGDDDYSSRWQHIKGSFTKLLKNQGIKLKRNKHGEYNVWQRRFWEHTIRDDKDLENHINYIHYNPIKHGFVKQLTNWPYSSFHRFVSNGLLERDWASHDNDESICFGE